ncbi:MAG: OFA family MFS transporter [Pseudomonadota bacterium]
MSSPSMNRWSVVIAGVIILMCLGVAYSWGIFLLPIDQKMGWGRAKISFAVSILLFAFSVFMAIGGLLEKKIGPRKTACIGGLLVGLGWVLASFAQSPFVLYLCYGVIAGIGTGLSYMPSISSGIKWFPDKKGLVTGIIVFGFGFGTAFLSPLITKLINLHGWRATMMLCGIVFGLIIAMAAQCLKVPSISNGAKDENSRDDAAFSPIEMLKTNSFRIMFSTYLISMIAGMMTIGHLVAFIADKNFNAMQGALALTILSIFNGVGRITCGYASDIWGGKKILVLLFSLIGSVMFALYHSSALPVIYVLSAVIGLCFGGFLAVYPSLTAEYFGRRDFSINYGLIFIGYGIGCFLGPLIGGWVHDIAKNYLVAFYLSGGLALIGSILINLFLNTPKIIIAKTDRIKGGI